LLELLESSTMKLKELESRLELVEEFPEPKLHYEQYITTPHLASQVLNRINQNYDDIRGKTVLDLGIGTGMLAIGCALLEADHVYGIDIDTDALHTCQSNIGHLELGGTIDLINADCRYLSEIAGDKMPLFKEVLFDTVVMNPPFGTKNISNGIDVQFIKLASKLTDNCIYSFHKSSTRDYMIRMAKSWSLEVEIISEMKYNIPKIESKNRNLKTSAKEKDILVDLIRFQKK
jgi:rRNA N6-adenosine-methyltransferase METTL5